jgi:hypothetical protein
MTIEPLEKRRESHIFAREWCQGRHVFRSSFSSVCNKMVSKYTSQAASLVSTEEVTTRQLPAVKVTWFVLLFWHYKLQRAIPIVSLQNSILLKQPTKNNALPWPGFATAEARNFLHFSIGLSGMHCCNSLCLSKKLTLSVTTMAQSGDFLVL